MAKKRTTLPKQFQELLETGDIEGLQQVYQTCEPNAKGDRYGSNGFQMTPLPREFAVWLKEQGADINRPDHYGRTPIFDHASSYRGDVRLLIELGADVNAGGKPFCLALPWWFCGQQCRRSVIPSQPRLG